MLSRSYRGSSFRLRLFFIARCFIVTNFIDLNHFSAFCGFFAFFVDLFCRVFLTVFIPLTSRSFLHFLRLRLPDVVSASILYYFFPFYFLSLSFIRCSDLVLITVHFDRSFSLMRKRDFLLSSSFDSALLFYTRFTYIQNMYVYIIF